MYRTRVLVFLILFVLKICNEVDGGCTLSLQKDLGDPSPVYLHNGGFLSPSNVSGAILLRRSETVRVACPGDKRFIVLGKNQTGFNLIDIKCVKDTTFRAVKSSWVGNFSEVTCNVVMPWFAVEEAGSCFRGYRLYRVGYKVDNVFHTTYEACFNKELLHTAYVQHELQVKTNVTQPGRRPQFRGMLFREGELFGKVKMSKVYSNQSNRIKEVFGDKKLEEYVNKNQFLSRGHLAPRADFPLYSVQRTSFHYVNSAPQWMRGNAGDWAALEEAVRRRALRSEAKLQVYTGGVGVLSLPDVSSTYKELYLSDDENNNGIIPVPLYMFKTIYEPSTKSAVVFLSINSSHFNSTMTDKLTFCNDICDSKQYSWLRWRSSDGTHSFCCTYEEFIKKYDVIPKLNVERVFY